MRSLYGFMDKVHNSKIIINPYTIFKLQLGNYNPTYLRSSMDH